MTLKDDIIKVWDDGALYLELSKGFMTLKDDIIKVWDDGALYLGSSKGFIEGSLSLIRFEILKTMIPPSESIEVVITERMTSVSNIVMNYGQMSLSEHKEEFPECWI